MNLDPGKIAVIGWGAMAQSVWRSLTERDTGVRIRAALLRSNGPGAMPDEVRLFRSVDDLVVWKPSVVLECASHSAVRDAVPQLLARGIDVIVASIGALADQQVRSHLQAASYDGGGRMTIVSGAVGGLDVLRSARLAGLDVVSYTGRKPPSAWMGTPAEGLLDLTRLSTPQSFFHGSATEAAANYPKNANVTAAVALAGVGFERTRVTLIADPTVPGNVHEVAASGAFGQFQITLENKPLPTNQKTSWLAALSIEESLLRHFQCTSF
jgi:aspartate dehydrogenase